MRATIQQPRDARGHDGFRIIGQAPTEVDGIADGGGVDSQMLIASEALFLKRETIAPGARAIPHFHSTASIIAILEGDVRINYGNAFQHTDFATKGEFIFIPALMPHQPINESDRPIVCLVVRNAPWDEVIPCN